MFPHPKALVAVEDSGFNPYNMNGYPQSSQTTSKPQSQFPDLQWLDNFSSTVDAIGWNVDRTFPSDLVPSHCPDLVGTPTLSYTPHQSPASVSTITPRLLLSGDKALLATESHEVAGNSVSLPLDLPFPQCSQTSVSTDWPVGHGYEEPEQMDPSLGLSIMPPSDLQKVQEPLLLTQPLTYSRPLLSTSLPQADLLHPSLSTSTSSLYPQTFIDPSQPQLYSYPFLHSASQLHSIPYFLPPNLALENRSLLQQETDFAFLSAMHQNLIQGQSTNLPAERMEQAPVSFPHPIGAEVTSTETFGTCSMTSSCGLQGHPNFCPCYIRSAPFASSTLPYSSNSGMSTGAFGPSSFSVPFSIHPQPPYKGSAARVAMPVIGSSNLSSATWIAQQQHQYQRHVEVDKKARSADTMLWAKQARALAEDPSPEYIQSLFEITPSPQNGSGL